MGEVGEPYSDRACGGLGTADCQLGSAFETLPYVLALIDGEGVYRRVNRLTRETFGFDPTGLHRFDVASRLKASLPDGRSLSPENMPSSTALGGKPIDDFEYVITNAKGERRWLLASIVPLLADDAVDGVLILNKDITARKNAEAEKLKTETRLRLLSETSASLLASSDPRSVVRGLCERVMLHLDCQVFFSFQADQRSGRLRLLACAGISSEEEANLGWLDYGVAVCGCVARDRERIIALDIQNSRDPRTELVKSLGVQAYCCHPLSGPDGELLGTLSFGTTNRTTFAPDEIEFMKAIADLEAMALQRERERWVLARSEARLKLFIEHAPAAIAMLDRDLCYISVSNRWREDYGLGDRDLTGVWHYEVFPNLPEEWKAVHRRALAGEVVKAEDDPFVDGRGVKRWVRWEVRPWYGVSGVVAGIAIITEDVTKQVTDREALKASERLYRAIGESIDFGVWVCDPEGRNTYASESFLKMVGCTQEECSNFGWGKLLHPDDERATIAAWKECVASGDFWSREHRFRDAAGHWRDVLARGVQVRDEDGRVLCWAGINLDISEVKEAERELARTLTRLDFHFENTPLAVVEWDADFKVIRWAGAAERIFGWSAQEVLGHYITELNLIHPEDEAKVAGLVEGMLAGRQLSNVNANRNLRRDGSIIHCEWHNSALIGGDGKLQSVLSLVLDVTERDLLTEELIGAKEAAEAANRAKSEFLARMSHELRTPLNGINGMIELALRQGIDHKARGYLALARESSDGLLGIINDLLNLARIEAGRVELVNSTFKPAALLDYLASLYGAEAGAKGLELKLYVEPGVPEFVLGDEGHLRQVLVNLLGNALKFTPSGFISLSAGVSPLPSEPGRVRLRFTVTDTGIGIEEEQLPCVFDSFSPATRLTHAQFGGTGLGLSISKQLIALMGGEITVESVVGLGTTFAFNVLFDLATQAQGDAVVATPEHKEKHRTPLRILLVEDNSTNRIFAQAVIEGQGHTVLCAVDGLDALTILQRSAVDLIMTDIQMPRLDGLGLTRQVRGGAAPNCPRDIPIIAMTAHAFAEDRTRFMQAGMNDYVTKPIDLNKLDLVLEVWSDTLRNDGATVKSETPPNPDLERVDRRLKELFDRLPPAKVWELLNLALEQMEPGIDRLETLIAAGDAKGMGDEAHRLRGTWTVVLGSDRMIEISTTLENMSREGDLEGSLELVEELRYEVAGVTEFVRGKREAWG